MCFVLIKHNMHVFCPNKTQHACVKVMFIPIQLSSNPGNRNTDVRSLTSSLSPQSLTTPPHRQTGPRGEAAVTKLGGRQIRGGKGADQFLTGHGTPISTPSISKLDKGGVGGGGRGGRGQGRGGGGRMRYKVDKTCCVWRIHVTPQSKKTQ